MPDRYSNEAARSAGPDIDEDVPAHALERIAALERLARDLYRAAGPRRMASPSNLVARSRMDRDLERRACELLDLDPPGFNPATEGP